MKLRMQVEVDVLEDDGLPTVDSYQRFEVPYKYKTEVIRWCKWAEKQQQLEDKLEGAQ